jgi:uncharacterized membrane protein YqjE
MDDSPVTCQDLLAASGRVLERMLNIAENRLELLAVEVQEERERSIHAMFMACGAAGFGLLSCLALTAAIVVAWWSYAPVVVLLVLAAIYAVAGAGLYWWLSRCLGEWRMFTASLEQLKKDRASLAGRSCKP